eukprot:NODE_69_length_23719_cov_0.556689.p15 type:complete len:118 gc:universal NODE_69_length_23719_cov_0.556689:3359-3712(+)
MLPSHVLENSCGHLVSIECKNGDFYNGVLDKCDHFMNCKVKDGIIIKTSSLPPTQLKAAVVFVKGSSIKCIRLSKDCLDKPKTDKKQFSRKRGGQRGGSRGSRGRGRGRSRNNTNKS